MPLFVAWLYRAVPIIVGLVVVGLVVYVVLYNSRGAQAAKNAFARIFWWICLVATAFFLLVTLYAYGENNTSIGEFFLICAGTTAAFWAVDALFGYLMRRRDRERRIANMARPGKGGGSGNE